MEKDSSRLTRWLKQIKRYYKQPWFQGRSSRFDRAVFRLFAFLNYVGKKLSPELFKSWLYDKSLQHLLEPLPYEPTHPLLGSPEEETAFWEYKKKRFLEVAQPCDVILVRGNQRISRIIQTLTHSPYSHAAFYRGNGEIIEAEPEGVLVSTIDKYLHLDIRICRPLMLHAKGRKVLLAHMEEMLQKQPPYDVANIEKLLFKYIYAKFRPDLQVYIGGSTKFETYYICSGLIAHGFHKAGYPITPILQFRKSQQKEQANLESVDDYFQWVRHAKKNYSQIVPADFDNSSFFTSIKFLFIENKPRSRKRQFQEVLPLETETSPEMPETD